MVLGIPELQKYADGRIIGITELQKDADVKVLDAGPKRDPTMLVQDTGQVPRPSQVHSFVARSRTREMRAPAIVDALPKLTFLEQRLHDLAWKG